MKASAILALLGAASLASAETCSGFETRLTNLANQVQAMIDIVEAMQPNAASTCGGIVGAKIFGATFMSTLFTDGRSGHPDYSAYAMSPAWCCEQCMATSGCDFWSLQFSGVLRCQLYAGKDAGSRENTWDPSGFLFMQALGVGAGVNRVSGRLPVAGTWGSSSVSGQGDYMVNTMASGVNTYQWWNYDGTGTNPGGSLAEGYEMCDTIGPYKPTFVAGNSDTNGYAITYYARNPLDCCSICVRNVGISGAPNTMDVGGTDVWAGQSCALWAYNYDSRKRHCRVRQDSFLYNSADMSPSALSTLDLTTEAGLTALQNGAQCSPTNVAGDPRFYPDNSTPCVGAFGPTQWSTGMPWASELANVPLA